MFANFINSLNLQEKKRKEWLERTVKDSLVGFERALRCNGTGYFVTDKVMIKIRNTMPFTTSIDKHQAVLYFMFFSV